MSLSLHQLLLLVVVFLDASGSSGSQENPVCGFTKRDRSPTAAAADYFHIQCFCRRPARPNRPASASQRNRRPPRPPSRYVGQLSFLNPLLTRLTGRLTQGGRVAFDGNRSVIFINCQQLNLNLDFGALPDVEKGSTFRLKIQGSDVVHINQIGLAFDQNHLVEFSDIEGRVSFTGEINCQGCQNNTMSAAIHSQASPALLSVETNHVDELSLYNVQARVPMKLTALHSREVSVSQSVFHTVPWPGFYIYNVTRVSIVKNHFVDAAPSSLLARMGTEIILAENILDVASAVDLSLFNHMTIRCNRPSPEAPHSKAMNCLEPVGQTTPFLANLGLDWLMPLHLQLPFVVILLIWVTLFTLLLTLAIVWTIMSACCCCCCCPRWTRDKEYIRNESPKKMSPEQKAVVARASILKKQRQKPLESRPDSSLFNPAPTPPQNYVRVDQVREEPDPEEGVVHGSLTLTGAWPNNVKKIRAVSDDGQTTTEAETELLAGTEGEAKKKKRKKKKAGTETAPSSNVGVEKGVPNSNAMEEKAPPSLNTTREKSAPNSNPVKGNNPPDSNPKMAEPLSNRTTANSVEKEPEKAVARNQNAVPDLRSKELSRPERAKIPKSPGISNLAEAKDSKLEKAATDMPTGKIVKSPGNSNLASGTSNAAVAEVKKSPAGKNTGGGLKTIGELNLEDHVEAEKFNKVETLKNKWNGKVDKRNQDPKKFAKEDDWSAPGGQERKRDSQDLGRYTTV